MDNISSDVYDNLSDFILILSIVYQTKGQLILKANCQAEDSSKKRIFQKLSGDG